MNLKDKRLWIFIALIVIALIIFIYPKSCGYNTSKGGETCKCMGMEKSIRENNTYSKYCIGICSDCWTYGKPKCWNNITGKEC